MRGTARAPRGGRGGGRQVAAPHRSMAQSFGPPAYTLDDLPVEDRRAVLERIARPVLDALEQVYRRLYQDNRPLMEYLRTAAASVPPALVTAAVVAVTG